MRLALFNDWRLGVVSIPSVNITGDQLTETMITDVTGALPTGRDSDPFGAGWWVRLCRDFRRLAPALADLADRGTACPIREVRLRPPVLNPGKVIATASNYAAHITEMREGVLGRVAGRVDEWLLDFDVFLKSPSSIIGPGEPVVLPSGPHADGKEIHHESELTLVIGQGGRDIPAASALDHVLGYTIGLDMTVRGNGDRSRRKSYDTFTPLGPWVVTSDEIPDPSGLEVRLDVDGENRQLAKTADMLVDVGGIIAYASGVMRLEPGDVILTGAPPGVGQVHPGETMVSTITGIGTMHNPVER